MASIATSIQQRDIRAIEIEADGRGRIKEKLVLSYESILAHFSEWRLCFYDGVDDDGLSLGNFLIIHTTLKSFNVVIEGRSESSHIAV